MKMYRITAYIIGFNGLTDEDIKSELENNKYFLSPMIKTEEVDIGEWEDDNILNYRGTPIEEFERYFENE